MRVTITSIDQPPVHNVASDGKVYRFMTSFRSELRICGTSGTYDAADIIHLIRLVHCASDSKGNFLLRRRQVQKFLIFFSLLSR